MREIWVKISGAAGAKVYNLLLSIATLSLTARLLGPEGRGEVGAVLAWVALFSTLGHLSLGSVAIHQLTLERGSARVAELFGSLLVYAGLLTLLGWVVAALLFAFQGKSVFGGLPGTSLAIGFLGLPFMLWQVYGQSLLMGLDRANHFNRAIMVGRTANFVAVYLMVGWFAWGTKGAICAAVLAGLITAAGGIRVLAKQAEYRLMPSMKCISTLAKGALRLHLNAVGTYLFTQSGVLVVNHYHGAAATGNYQLAAQLIGVMLIIPNAVSQIVYGIVTKHGPDGAWPINRNILHRSMAITAASIMVAWLTAPYLIRLVAGPGFDEAIGYFRAMLPMLLGGTLSAAMAPQWIGRGFFWQASLLTLFVGVCGISISLTLTPGVGAKGAIYATLVAYVIGAIFNIGLYIYCSRRQPSPAGREEL